MVVMIAHKYFVFVLIMYLYDLIVHNNLLHKHCYFQFWDGKMEAQTGDASKFQFPSQVVWILSPFLAHYQPGNSYGNQCPWH